MEQSQAINIADAALQEAGAQGAEAFLQVFTDKYLEVTGGAPDATTIERLNGHQHTLLGYYFLRKELYEGGFVQLIQNGYGSYIFENPFAKAMRLFGAEEFSKLIYKAKKIYDANKADLERECTDEEFMAMYEQYEAFDELEEAFLEMQDEVTDAVAHYVDDNLPLFAEVV